MEETTQTPAETPKDAKSTSGVNKTKATALFLLLLAVIGLGAYILGSNKKAPEASPSPSATSGQTPTASPEDSPTPTPKPTKSPTPTPTKTATPVPTPVSTSKTITSTASLDGFESSNGGGNTTLDIRAGRNSNLVTRGFVSFDLGSIPAGAVIEKATLRLYQKSVIGNPYGVGGSLKLDHLDYGSSFENGDYSAASLSSSFATLTSNAATEYKDVDVTDQVKSDLAASRSRSQYRAHFAVESIGGDVTGDFAYFESADNSLGTGSTPQLVIKYH